MVETAKNHIETGLATQKVLANPFNPQNALPSRQDILLKLYNRSLWIANKIDNRHVKIDENLKTRVNFARVECQFYTAILDGLKDVELDDLAKQILEIKEDLAKKNP